MDSGFGGKEYQIEKRRIPMPRAPRKLSAETKCKYAENLWKARQVLKIPLYRQNLTRKTKTRGNLLTSSQDQ
ncbi:MAG: hypothetical protein JRJ75_17590 [Deltaproteobacteria bacterium]|nr:hypothetical protein [Deltaproteobacteria bacterium]